MQIKEADGRPNDAHWIQRSSDHLNATGEELWRLRVQDLENTNNEEQLKDLANKLSKIDEVAEAVVELATIARDYVNSKPVYRDPPSNIA